METEDVVNMDPWDLQFRSLQIRVLQAREEWKKRGTDKLEGTLLESARTRGLVIVDGETLRQAAGFGKTCTALEDDLGRWWRGGFKVYPALMPTQERWYVFHLSAMPVERTGAEALATDRLNDLPLHRVRRGPFRCGEERDAWILAVSNLLGWLELPGGDA